MDEALREEIESLVLAVAQKDPTALTDAVWNLSVLPPICLRDQLQADLADFVAEFTGPSLLEFDLKGALRNLTDIIHRHHILRLPARRCCCERWFCWRAQPRNSTRSSA